MTGVMFYDKEYSCLSKTMVTHRHVTITILTRVGAHASHGSKIKD